MTKFPLRHFFYISNVLSLLRLILIFPIVYLLKINTATGNLWLVVLAVILISSDYFDGLLARKLNQVTDLGKLLDPLTDKISMAVILVALIIFRQFPLSLVILLIYRDLLILVAGTLIARRDRIPESNWWGKVNTTVVSLAGFFFILNMRNVAFMVFLFASYLTILISAIVYYAWGEHLFFKTGAQKWAARGLLIIVTLLLLTFILPLDFDYFAGLLGI
jgi:CDP-diacylglycerol--glycerol-3-phosphate 3-phosphatidyltransferase